MDSRLKKLKHNTKKGQKKRKREDVEHGTELGKIMNRAIDELWEYMNECALKGDVECTLIPSDLFTVEDREFMGSYSGLMDCLLNEMQGFETLHFSLNGGNWLKADWSTLLIKNKKIK